MPENINVKQLLAKAIPCVGIDSISGVHCRIEADHMARRCGLSRRTANANALRTAADENSH